MDAAKKTVFVLSLIVFFVMLGIMMITPNIVEYANTLGADAFLAGVLVGALPAARVLLDLPASAFGKRFGNARMMRDGLAIIIVSSLGAAIAFNYYMLLAVRFLEGVGSALYVTSSLAALAKASPMEKRGRYMAIYVNMLLVGQIFGPAVGSLVVLQWGLRAPFVVYGICAAAGLVLVVTTLKLGEDSSPSPLDWGMAKRLFRDRHFLTVNVGVLAAFFARAGVITMALPYFIESNWGLSAVDRGVTTGILITVLAGASFFTMYPSGALADRYGRKWTFVSSLLLMAVAIPFIYNAHDLLSAIPVAVGLGLTLGLTGPMASWAADLAPEDSMDVAMGVYRSISDFGFLLGPIVLGAVIQVSQVGSRITQAPFLVASVWLFLSGLLLLTARDPAGERARARSRELAADPPKFG